MVEGECIHRGNLIPKTAISSQKATLRESNFKRYGRSRVYTHRKFDSQNGHFEPESSFTGIKFQKDTKSYGAVKMFFPEPCSDACPTWQNNLKRNLRLPCARLGFKTGIAKAKNFTKSNQTFYVYTFSFYHTSGNLIPVKLLFGSKWPFWESNLLCVYTLLLPYLLKFDSRKAAFWLEMAVLGIKPMCLHSPSTIPFELLIPVKLLFGSKWPFWESNFLCVYTLLLPYLLKFDSRKASFWLKRAVLGIKISMCIHYPSTIPLEI